MECRRLPSLSALQYYAITGYQGNFNASAAYNSILSSMPVIVVGWNQAQTEGHTWLIDGIHRTITHYSETIIFEYDENWIHADEVYDTFEELRQRYNINTLDDIQIIPNAQSTTHYYFLMNWGWDGDHDSGRYYMNSGEDWLNFGYNRTMYYGFH